MGDFMRLLVAALMALPGLAWAGAPPAEPLDVPNLPIAERASAATVRLYEPHTEAPNAMPTPAAKTILGEVSATSCQRWPTSPFATKEDAALQLQIRARRMGATAVISVVYREDFARGLGPHVKGTPCMAVVFAIGIAITTE